jgi:endonuclease YncB( thermonuclease family)
MALKWMPLLAVLLVLTTLSPNLSWADFKAKVMSVQEGDRITIYHGGKTQALHLTGIDCPDPKQPYGKQAKRTTAAFIGGRDVTIRGMHHDKAGKAIAEVLLLDGRNVGHELVKEGLAWVRPETSTGKLLEEVQELARAEHKGLWSEPNPTPPWKWKQKPMFRQ